MAAVELDALAWLVAAGGVERELVPLPLSCCPHAASAAATGIDHAILIMRCSLG
jgi:hypothetical protein